MVRIANKSIIIQKTSDPTRPGVDRRRGRFISKSNGTATSSRLIIPIVDHRTFRPSTNTLHRSHILSKMPCTVHVAYTAPVNPSGSSPILTRPQLWRGLQRKVTRAQDFVPVIESCKVLEEKDGGREIIREAYFKAKTENGQHVPGQEGKTVREVCRLYGPVKVCWYHTQCPERVYTRAAVTNMKGSFSRWCSESRGALSANAWA